MSLMFSSNSDAIIHHFSDENSLKWGKNSKFAAVGQFGFASVSGIKSESTGVLIAPSVVLTCGHCVSFADSGFSAGWFSLDPNGIKGDTDPRSSLRLVDRVKVHESLSQDAGGVFSGTDLALVKLMSPMPQAPAVVFDGDPGSLIGKNSYVVGYGQSGVGSELKRVRDGKKRMGIIPVTRIEEKIAFLYSLLSEDPFHFAKNDKNPYLGVPTYGDSGGPLFVGSTDSVKVGGIYHGVNAREVFGAYVAQSLWVNVVPELEWIKKGVAELTASKESVTTAH